MMGNTFAKEGSFIILFVAEITLPTFNSGTKFTGGLQIISQSGRLNMSSRNYLSVFLTQNFEDLSKISNLEKLTSTFIINSRVWEAYVKETAHLKKKKKEAEKLKKKADKQKK